MAVTIDKIKWGSYGGFEGPYFKGEHAYVAPEKPDVPDKFLATIAATEGSAFDAINMYDRMIVSVGVIQWGEASQYSVSDMLGLVVERINLEYVLKCISPALVLSNATFAKNRVGSWRFAFNDSGGDVNTVEKQRNLFLNGKGATGSWNAESTLVAKTWAMCLANVWDDQRARDAQVEYTKKRLMGFVTSKAKEILFSDVTQVQSSGWPGAVRAAYISFAANLPAVASQHLEIAAAQATCEKWSEEWCISVIRELTFGPGIKIYPERYEKIRPVVEKFFGVALPKTAADLKAGVPGNVQQPALPIITYNYEPEITVKDDPAADVPLVAPASLFTVVIRFFAWLLSLFSGAKK